MTAPASVDLDRRRRRIFCAFYAVMFAVAGYTLKPSSVTLHPGDHLAWYTAAALWLIVGIAPTRRRRLLLVAAIGVAFTGRVITLIAGDFDVGALGPAAIYAGFGVALTMVIVIWPPIREP